MGLRDALFGRHEVKGPAPDKLFAITTAWVTLESAHSISPAGKAAIVFQALANSDFEATVKEMEEVVKATGGESGTTVATQDDSYGYRWMVLSNPAGAPTSKTSPSASTPSPARSRQPATASGCCAPCSPSLDAKGGADLLHLQLQARALVPVRAQAPASASRRDTERELQIKAQVGAELPIEPEIERWFPLWGIPYLSAWSTGRPRFRRSMRRDPHQVRRSTPGPRAARPKKI